MPNPMYRQIAEDLRQKIESGELGHGDQLPTELDLREAYDASRNTVRDAVKWLITRGLIETRPGQGTFVVAKIDPYVTILTGEPEMGGDEEGPVFLKKAQEGQKGEQRTPVRNDPRVEIQKAAGAGAEELQVPDGTTLVSRHQQRYIDDTPWSLQTSFYPIALSQRGADRLLQAENIEEGAVAYLREELGLKQAGYRDTITVRAPDATETTFFKLPDDGRVAVFEVRRTAFDDRGHPFRLTVSVYPTDRNQFAVNVGRVPGEVGEPISTSADGSPQPKTAALGGSG
jgi:GntR family transcriptional regulator